MPSSAPEKQLAAAEGWLEQRPNNPVLLLTLGRLCLQNERFDEAKAHLEASLQLTPSSEVAAELGRLCLVLGETERGNALLAQSMQSAGGDLLALPAPASVSDERQRVA